jgi:hypothetical protein
MRILGQRRLAEAQGLKVHSIYGNGYTF